MYNAIQCEVRQQNLAPEKAKDQPNTGGQADELERMVINAN